MQKPMQPAHISLWLRPDPPPRRTEGREQILYLNASSNPSAVLRPTEGIQ
jgi:hypothetical protein